ncbi:hypothetical protein OROMI_010930 [Orobanche minor]
MSGSTQRSIFVNSIDLNNDPVDEICELENGGRTLSNELEDIVRFSIRWGRCSTKNGKIIRRDFFCHIEGFPEKKILEPSKEQRNRQSSRCGCKAVLRITLKKAYDIFPEEWHVTQFNSRHTHELLQPALVRFLPSYRTISDDDKQQILLYKEVGLSVKQIMRVMELQKNVKHGDLTFLQKMSTIILVVFGEIFWSMMLYINLLEYYKATKIDNPNFQFDYTVDEFRRLENIFWSPAHCFDMYQEYGDSTGFDNTYRVNSYDMPFGIFIGIDNYGRTALFGCALLRNESRATFCWLVKTFLRLVKKSPKTIITDQDKWMTEAITKEMPYRKNAFVYGISHRSFLVGWTTLTILKENGPLLFQSSICNKISVSAPGLRKRKFESGHSKRQKKAKAKEYAEQHRGSIHKLYKKFKSQSDYSGPSGNEDSPQFNDTVFEAEEVNEESRERGLESDIIELDNINETLGEPELISEEVNVDGLMQENLNFSLQESEGNLDVNYMEDDGSIINIYDPRVWDNLAPKWKDLLVKKCL